MEPFARIPGRYDDEARRSAIDTAVARRRRSTHAANLGTFTGYRIGLDIGNGNVGWCVLFERGPVPLFLTAEDVAAHNAALPGDARRTQLPDLSSFVPLGTHKFTARTPDGISLSKARANAAAQRGTLDARRYRRWHLRQVLEKAGLFPRTGETTGGRSVDKADKLRVALLEPGAATHPHDLGRALYNALKRRGWMKPIGRLGKDEESGFGSRATANYRAALALSGCRTVGEFLDRCQTDHLRDHGVPIRKRHRPLEWQKLNGKLKKKEGEPAKSYELFPFLTPTTTLVWEEAELLRQAQADTVPISDAVWAQIQEAAEYRRPLKARAPGPCEFLEGKFRCVRALPSFQEFRLLQQVDNLRLIGGTPLDPSTANRAADYLRKHEKVGLRELERELGSGRFHVGKDDSRTLHGAKTDIALAAALGEAWLGIADIAERDRWVMRFLRRHEPRHASEGPDISPWDPKRDEEKLAADCGVAFGHDALERIDADAVKLLDDRFSNVSVEAARLLADGYRRHLDHDARLALLKTKAPQIEVFDQLPYYGRVMSELCVPAGSFAPKERTSADELTHGRVANPDVHVVLNRVRKVVNAVIAMMGGILPTTCTVEIARDALSEAEADKRAMQVRQREKLRRVVERDIGAIMTGLGRKMPYGPRLDRIVDRFLAAHRQGWTDYDGSAIPRSHLVDGDTYQLDHVSPAAFGEFRQSNLFVSRFNQQKGRRLPWEAFSGFHEVLLAFATVGEESRLAALKGIVARGKLQPKRRKSLEEAIARSQAELAGLSQHGAPRPDILTRLRRAKDDPLDSLVETPEGEEELRGVRKDAFRPGDQAALFRRLGPGAKIPEGDYAPRDVANIGWSTKLTRRYFVHLGARTVSVKPWAIHALRCMFDINKCRPDLRNHAVDAFLAAHFDEQVMNHAFARLQGQGYESLYDRRFLQQALSSIADAAGVFEAIESNLARLEAALPTIATAHRPDNQWNPGDAAGGSFGALGGQNIYSFRPDSVSLASLNNVLRKARQQAENALPYDKAKIVAFLTERPNDPKEMRLQQKLKSGIKLRYRDRKGETPKLTELSLVTAKPMKSQPGAYIDVEGKFAIASATEAIKREIVSVADFSKADTESRARYFAGHRSVYRSGDTVILNGQALVVTGLRADGRLDAYPVDTALRTKEQLQRPTVPSSVKERPLKQVDVDVLGRRLHRLRKTPGGLAPVPYPLRGE